MDNEWISYISLSDNHILCPIKDPKYNPALFDDSICIPPYILELPDELAIFK